MVLISNKLWVMTAILNNWNYPMVRAPHLLWCYYIIMYISLVFTKEKQSISSKTWLPTSLLN